MALLVTFDEAPINRQKWSLQGLVQKTCPNNINQNGKGKNKNQLVIGNNDKHCKIEGDS